MGRLSEVDNRAVDSSLVLLSSHLNLSSPAFISGALVCSPLLPRNLVFVVLASCLDCVLLLTKTLLRLCSLFEGGVYCPFSFFSGLFCFVFLPDAVALLCFFFLGGAYRGVYFSPLAFLVGRYFLGLRSWVVLVLLILADFLSPWSIVPFASIAACFRALFVCWGCLLATSAFLGGGCALFPRWGCFVELSFWVLGVLIPSWAWYPLLRVSVFPGIPWWMFALF